MAPTTGATITTRWCCLRCKKASEMSAPSPLTAPVRQVAATVRSRTPDPQDFRRRGGVVLTSVSRDFQGAVVGPGPRVEGDLCDRCLEEVWAFLLQTPTPTTTERTDA